MKRIAKKTRERVVELLRCAAFAMGQRASLGLNRDAWRPGCRKPARGME